MTLRGRIALGAAAAGIVLAATFSPLAELGEERLFSAHMAQHLLLGDIAPLLLALALGRRAALLHPLPATILWAGALGLWHGPRLYDAALGNEALHQLQHLAFFVTGLLLWAAILSPRAAVAWRAGAVAAVGAVGTALGNVFLWAGAVIYTPYLDAPRTAGLSPLSDQQLGGAIMLAEGAAVTIAVFAWLVLRWFEEGEGRAEPA